ncbi:MAG: SPOR domain-containing protein [Betaproteobacteria bacterium]
MLRILLLLGCLALSGCATVIISTTQPVRVETFDAAGVEVKDARCELSNPEGTFNVTTPGQIILRKSASDLQARCSADGQPAEARGVLVSRLGDAIFGNIILGGAIGAVIDHASGSAYSYPSWVQLVFGRTLSFDRAEQKDGERPVAFELRVGKREPFRLGGAAVAAARGSGAGGSGTAGAPAAVAAAGPAVAPPPAPVAMAQPVAPPQRAEPAPVPAAPVPAAPAPAAPPTQAAAASPAVEEPRTLVAAVSTQAAAATAAAPTAAVPAAAMVAPAREAKTDSGGRFAVQVASLRVASAAQSVRDRVPQQLAGSELAAQPVHVLALPSDRAVVLVGGTDDRAQADQLAERLRQLLRQDVLVIGG